MGSIYRRGSILWLKYYQGGRAIRESSGTGNRAAAVRMLKNREGDVAKEIPIEPQVGRITFDEAAADLLNDYKTNKRKSTGDVERKIRLHLRPAFGHCRLSSITTTQIRAFSADRQNAGASNAEINRELAALKRMFALAIQSGMLHHKPHVPMLQENNARQGFFEAEQYRAVLAHLPVELRPVVTFAYLTGWRTKSEILPLEWRNVDVRLRVVRLDAVSTKNGETRELPYGDVPELVRLFEELRAETTKAEQADGKIIPSVFHRAGRPIRDFRAAWQSACKAAGCPGRIPHDLRRTAVRNLDQAGVSQALAMQITGHKTASVYRRYRIVSSQDLKLALGKLSLSNRETTTDRSRMR